MFFSLFFVKYAAFGQTCSMGETYRPHISFVIPGCGGAAECAGSVECVCVCVRAAVCRLGVVCACVFGGVLTYPV